MYIGNYNYSLHVVLLPFETITNHKVSEFSSASNCDSDSDYVRAKRSN